MVIEGMPRLRLSDLLQVVFTLYSLSSSTSFQIQKYRESSSILLPVHTVRYNHRILSLRSELISDYSEFIVPKVHVPTRVEESFNFPTASKLSTLDYLIIIYRVIMKGLKSIIKRLWSENLKKNNSHTNLYSEMVSIDWNKIKRENIIPILAIVNRKSGGLRGKRAIENLQKVLNEIQICDLSDNNISEFLALYKTMKIDLKIICCGGDGTIGWVMDEVYSADLYDGRAISYGIIPFGTGNDLFNHISNLSGRKSFFLRLFSADSLVSRAKKVLKLFSNNHCQKASLDRWAAAIAPKPRKIKKALVRALSKDKKPKASRVNTLMTFIKKLTIPMKVRVAYRRFRYKAIRQLKKEKPTNVKVFNNYFGIGVDGAVALAFSEFRRKFPIIFFHQLINKMWYAIVGLITFLFHKRFDLSKTVEINCDGRPCVIPEGCQGIIVTNIASYAGGSKLWTFQNDPWKPQRADDGVVEVVGVTGVAHLAQIKTGLSSPIPIAQGKNIHISTKLRMPMQIDGEPWSQRACNISISMRERYQR